MKCDTIIIIMRGNIGRVWRVASVGLLVVALFPTVALADTAISQGFDTNDPIIAGALMSTQSKSKAVQYASTSTADKLVGVVSSQSLVELSNSNSKQVQIVTNGTVSTLVSTINGTIAVGDKVTASPIKGVGMKAVRSGYIVGTAQAAFSEATDLTEQVVVDKDGNKQTVKVGMIPVQINVSFYESSDAKQSIIPDFITRFARAVAGRDVSVIRILIAFIILITGIGSISALMYSSVRSSIISIGRNPLAASAVHRSLLEVSLLAIGALLVMLGAVYLVLVI